MAQQFAADTPGQRSFVFFFIEAEHLGPLRPASPRVVVLFVKGLIMDWELLSLMRHVNNGAIPVIGDVFRDPGVEMQSYGVAIMQAEVVPSFREQSTGEPHAGSTACQCALPLPLAQLWARYGAPLEGNMIPVAVPEEIFLQEKTKMTECLHRMQELSHPSP